MRDWKQVVHERDKVCQICGTQGSKNNPLTVHHIKPKCQGGPNTPENGILYCKNCHHDYHKQQGFPSRSKRKKSKHRRR